MKSMRLAFLLCLALLIWATIKVQRCHAVSIDPGKTTSFKTVLAQNPGLTPSQVLQDIVAEGNVVIFIGADRCLYCQDTMKALEIICAAYPAEYPDVVFIYVNADKYRAFRTMKTIPELRFYKNGKLIQKTESKRTPAEWRHVLNSIYKKHK